MAYHNDGQLNVLGDKNLNIRSKTQWVLKTTITEWVNNKYWKITNHTDIDNKKYLKQTLFIILIQNKWVLSFL